MGHQTRCARGTEEKVIQMSGKTQGRRVAIYARKSTDDGGDGRSIDAQLHDCHALAKAHGYEVVEYYNEGAGVSASHLANQERTEFRRALDDFGVEYDCLISWALDRLTRRGAGEMAEMFDLVEERNGGRRPPKPPPDAVRGQAVPSDTSRPILQRPLSVRWSSG